MIAIASRSISNNKPRTSNSNGSTNYNAAIKQKTPEEKAAQEEAYQKKYAEQTSLFNQCQEKASLNPPEYPIKIRFNNNYFETILRDNNNNLVFASSFNDAVKKVQQEIGSMESVLMDQFKASRYYKDGDVLRLSSANKSIFNSILGNANLNSPEGRYYIMDSISKTPIPCWTIIISSAKPTIISSMRIASQNRYNTGGKSRAKKSTFRKSTFRKSTFRKGRAKKSRKSKRRY
jgi:hypothetical protein